MILTQELFEKFGHIWTIQNARFSRFSHLYPLASKYPLHGSVAAPCSQRVDWGQPQYRCAHVEALRKPGFFKAKKRIQNIASKQAVKF